MDKKLNGNYIDSNVFFGIYKFYELFDTGIIITPPIYRQSLNFNDHKSSFSKGIYLCKIDENGETIDFTIDTPIIYNLGDGHFVPGINTINKDLVNYINENNNCDYGLIRSITSPIEVGKKGKNVSNYEIIKKEEINNFFSPKSVCKFKIGNIISFKGIDYVVLDSKTLDGEICIQYTVSTLSGDESPKIYIIYNIDNIQKTDKKDMNIKDIIDLVSTKYGNNSIKQKYTYIEINDKIIKPEFLVN
jgi:hypothetical protein